jgi:aminopeptidase N
MVELDCSFNDVHKIEIDSIYYSYSASEGDGKKLNYRQSNDKLWIEIGEKLPEGSKFYLIITYTSKGTKPPDGFVFIESPEKGTLQAWTQGETTASKKWFPCLDHPQAKFPRQISVTVPSRFIAISNGERNILDMESNGEGKRKFVWEESMPITTYVTSVVAGDFAELPKMFFDKRVPLLYFVPKGREDDGIRLFKNTPNMMEFFESYLGTKYPYDKYSQVTVEDFEYGGMENTTCTTFTTRILPNEKTVQDLDTFDYVVVHELAHQWFGDLVTCRDWQHIWLNESFASYCEALYYQKALGDDAFQYYMLNKMDDYLNADADTVHNIPLVTNQYAEPIDMFTYARTYQKGACVINMIRHLLGEEDFRKSMKEYFQTYKNKTAETDDLRKTLEQNSNISLTKFFEQWIYQSGHPQINAAYTVKDSRLTIKLEQTQSLRYDFSLDVIVVFQTAQGDEKRIEDTITVSDNTVEKKYDLPPGAAVKRIAIDPQLKILKQLNTVNLPMNKPMLIESLRNGETAIEKIHAARALRENPTNEFIRPLKEIVLNEKIYWGIRSEVAKTLASVKTEESYNALKDCFGQLKSNRVRETVVQSLGPYSKAGTFDLLKGVLEDKGESEFVKRAVAISIAQSGNEEEAFPILSGTLDTNSYKSIVARGGIEGLKILAIESIDKEISKRAVSLLIEKSKAGNESTQRQSAVSALGYIAKYQKDQKDIKEHLKSLLTDDSLHVRNTAFSSIGNALAHSQDEETIRELKEKIKAEGNEFVKKTGKKSVMLISKATGPQLSTALEKPTLKEKSHRIDEIDRMEKSIVLH